MYRAPTIAFAIVSLLPVGCANTWDTITSRSLRENPRKTIRNMVSPEDPMVVLRGGSDRTGDERAKAMNRLKEPLRNRGTQEDQDQILEILSRTATTDTSPVLRYAAINALGRFEDPRVVGILMQAYQKADGQSDAVVPRQPEAGPIVPVGGLSAGRSPTRGGFEPLLDGPTGFAPDTVAALRCRCLESLGGTHKVEAARFLAAVAGANGPTTNANEAGIVQASGTDVEIRQAAVRGLGMCRQADSVVALATVLNIETGKDPTLVRGAHQGLVRLTGKRLPPDPAQWTAVAQADIKIAPEPTWFENAVQSAMFWEKK